MRAHPTKTPALAPPLAPGGERVAVFGVPDFCFPAALAEEPFSTKTRGFGFAPCPESEKMWVRYGGIKNNAVKAAFKTAGFRVLADPHRGAAPEKETGTENGTASREPRKPVPSRPPPGAFNVAWNGALRKGDFERLNAHQRVNHFPGTWELGRKDKLGANLEKARRRRPDAYGFAPRSFLLPRDAGAWREDRARLGPRAAYIVKPPASSRGRGVRMLREGDFERLTATRRGRTGDADGARRDDKSDKTSRKSVLVQRYIRDPHLLDGYKYDLRVYVALTSLDPLRVFLYREGLVRLATEKYVDGGADPSRRCMHLTNYSVNAKTAGFTMGARATEEDGVGFKRSLSSLRRRFEADGADFERVWARIKDIVVKTLACAEGPMRVASAARVPGSAKRACYELFGFDIMLDAALEPWLIEVNTGPSLSAPSALDLHVKHRMVANLFNLVGVAPFDRAKTKREASARRRARLAGALAPGRARREGSEGSFSAREETGVSSRAGSASGARGAPRRSASPPARRASARGLERVSRDPPAAGPPPKKMDFPSASELLRGGPRALQDLDFSLYAFEALPRAIRDAEGELSRAGEFERCFPTPDPDLNASYLELFETRRHENALLCAWERHKKALRRRHRLSLQRRAKAPSSARLGDETRRGSAVGAAAEKKETHRQTVSAETKKKSAPVSRLAPRGVQTSDVSNASSRLYEQLVTPRSSPPAAADVDALASSLAGRLGVTRGWLNDSAASSKKRAEEALVGTRFATRGAFFGPSRGGVSDWRRPARARDAVRSVGSKLEPPAPTKRTTASMVGVSAPLGVKGEGRKKAAVPESVLARARRTYS